MAEPKLREAFELMKQGEKNQAMMIVRGVLREDSSNVDAWWLMANVLEDEEKIVKSLNKVLELNPSHSGAKKKLAQLRPGTVQNLSNLVVPDSIQANPNSGNFPDAQMPQGAKRGGGFMSGMGSRILTFIVVAGIAFAYGFWTEMLPRMRQVDDNGNTPLDVALEYTEATVYLDATKMREMSCESQLYRADEAEQELQQYGLPNDYKVDMTGVTTEVVRLQLNEASVAFHGDLVLSGNGETFTYNYDQDAREGGFDWIVEHLKRIDGVWIICDGPEYIYD